ncbi:hypothetical protein C499_02499 [Halogeometricum borinquense DSM 11551]|uniref:Uncharacterized protein n=3 Tax=Halogeometricum borinquense TaxID=60847 RepID=E4NPV7_HALBP|nr:hypothetical protein Hbor_09960 [Halogeometricum borinquense DSM 11551]ELY30698.1 hypothetical protein C499_02499 [Halogeometricum borinquense DSM 11551]RYJ14446.1 hypothetical protein ELS19_11095 [Halogeometricum borinquense]
MARFYPSFVRHYEHVRGGFPAPPRTFRVMSPRTNAPAMVPAGSGPSDATANARDAESEDDDSSDIRTATRLLRLVKLVLGVLVSLLTALKLLGLL